MKARRMGRVDALLALSTCLLGCAAPYAPAPTHSSVPAPLPEQVTAPPPSRTVLIWRPGFHDWNGYAYVWTPGQWVERAGHGALWQDGYWRRYGGTFV